METRDITRVCLMLITTVFIFAVLKYAQNVFAPMMLALVFGIVLSPLSDLWDKFGVPPALAAFATLAVGLSILVTMAFLLEPYVSSAVEQGPIIWYELRDMLREMQAMLRGLDEISESVAEAIGPEKADADKEGVAVPTVADALYYAPQYAAQLMVFVGTLYFFLLSRTDIYKWVSRSSSRLDATHLIHAEKKVSRYFLTISMINSGFGVLVAIVMTLLEMPSPILWGLAAFLLNYILYLGPALLAVILALTGIVSFDGAYSFVPAVLYLAMNATEGQFVTPALVGKSLSVSPLLVFLSLVIWLWLWGPMGGFIAIPLLIWCLVVAKVVFAQNISSGTPGKLRPRFVEGEMS
ncbi:AI-2E family transporter [Litoreibacter arenae]|uniref:Transport protein n=1 Tax=Litoreibacter arenae DSM 19593 TaxID=1123360 RepID=S9QI04_9RHOB|nr:AI-2E family transporter [Litoreibacter arenae]EPX79462.1 hypothetical protein thalar_02287 [Litoreibacter arenae DSM 19593]